jgi:hypothetical protein
MADFFGKTALPKRLPRDMQNVVKKLRQCKTRLECLQTAYAILHKKYRGRRVLTYLRILEIGITDINILWNRDGFLHCNNINYVLRTLLVASGHFSDEDIKQRWTLIWYISPHQYLRVHVGKKTMSIDVWGADHGIAFGDYAYGFH